MPGITEVYRADAHAGAGGSPPLPAPPVPAKGRAPQADPAFARGNENSGFDAPPIELTHRKPAPAPQQAPPQKSAERAPGGSQSLIGRVKLVVEQGKILGEQFLLNDYELIVGRYDAGTGRCPDIDLTAQDPAYVHRQHVRLSFSPAGETLTAHDLGGRNGSYVNNKLIERNGAVRVKPGDKLRIGRVVMRLQLAPELEGDGTSA